MKLRDVILKPKDMVYIWNLELGRPEQINWIGIILSLSNKLDYTGSFLCSVLWSTGKITNIGIDRLAPTAVRKHDKKYGGTREFIIMRDCNIHDLN